MTGRGVDQILAHPSNPELRERWATSAEDYVRLAERRNGPIPRQVATSYVWADALSELRTSADRRIVNLETSVSSGGRPVPKGINYRMHPSNVGTLAAARLDCCVLSNNHVLDWGRGGLIETLETLHGAGLGTAGAGRHDAEARRPASLDLGDGGRLLVVGLGLASSGIPADWAAGPDRPGVNLVEPSVATAATLAEQLKPLRRSGDLVVASVHWGENWGYDVSEAQRSFAHALIDMAGVDLVHGHSSHHPKAIEVYRGRLILYGCGDLLNDYEGIGGYEAFRGDLSVVYFADLDRRDGRLLRLEMAPLRMRRFQLTRATTEDLVWLEIVLDREAARFGGRVSRAGARLVFSWE
jgi:poly-gamma-glutamate synthesis protein (capsule biosynthesis protein)